MAIKLPSCSILCRRLVLCLLLSGSVSAVSRGDIPPLLLSSLTDEDFKTREEAQTKLLEWCRKHSDRAEDLMFKQWSVSKCPETRQRCLEVLRVLVNDRYMTEGQGFVGIRMQDMKIQIPGEEGQRMAVQITEVIAGLAADKAGLRSGDMITGINGKPLAGERVTEYMRAAIINLKPGSKLTLQILRKDQKMDVEVTLVRRPVTADNLLLERDPQRARAAEQAAREEYFRKWLEDRKRGA